ncbi:MAG: DNA polymerase Y family protein [Deltaproteobacteria bacterium]|nr:DNA polymerase Y family protein [Deltaproteobacteria bacterium]
MNPTSKRYLCIYLPYWAVNLAQIQLRKTQNPQAHAAILLVSKSANQLLVRRCCLQAQRQGVRQGMPLPLAKALCPTALVLPFDPHKNFSALQKLAVRALQFSPLVSLDSELLRANKNKSLESADGLLSGILLDISGTEKLHGSERLLAEKISARFAKLSIQARIAVAPTIGAAWALSRFGSDVIQIVPTGKSIREAIADLPVEALRLPAESVTALHALGIHAIASLLRLPSRQLGIRFGTKLLERLDQACGTLQENFEAVQAPELIRALRRFEEPLIQHETIKVATLYLFQQMFKELAAKRKKAGCFTIIVEGRDQESLPFQRSKQVSLNTTTKNFQHIASVLDPLLSNLVIPGGVHALLVVAYDVERAHEQQSDFLSPTDLHFLVQSGHEFLNSLITRLGKERVSLVQFQDSHIPERSFAYRALPARYAQEERQAAAQPQALSLGRPPYLLRRPELITALSMLPDRPPVRLRWKGKELGILQASGPERISPEWWHLHSGAQEHEREYFKVQDHLGRWLWVFRDRRNMQWFVQGLWG